jgi:MFS transporter, MHS family, proline/betaine transporter
MTSLITLTNPTMADIPSRLVVFLIVWYAVFLIAVFVGPEPRGGLEREASQIFK